MHVPPVGHFYFLPPSRSFFAVRVIKTSSLGEIAAWGETGGRRGGAVSQKGKTDVVPLRKKGRGEEVYGQNVWCKAFQLHSMPLRMHLSSPLA